jgi:hypothetical protein
VIDRLVFAVGFVVLVLGTSGGPGWDSVDAVLAAELERSAAAPLYALVSTVAAYLPVGEVGFRLSLANAVLGAVLLVGVVRLARALLPKDPIAWLVAAGVLLVARPFRDAAGFAGPAMLASCGVVWSLAFTIAYARNRSGKPAAFAALACATVTIGSAPWLGGLLAAFVGGWLWRAGAKEQVGASLLPIGITIVVLWIGADGSLPSWRLDVEAAIAAILPATILVGIGLAAAAFAAVTGLPHGKPFFVAIALVAAHAIAVDPQPLPLLGLLAVGCAVVPGAVVRILATERRHVAAAVAGAPILAIALVESPAFSVDDPGAAPARLAGDLVNAQPPGPGIVFVRRAPDLYALAYAQRIAGVRPDLELAPVADERPVQAAFEARVIVGSDVPAFGTLQVDHAFPRGRGFQLLPAPPPSLAPIQPPARYASEIGVELATMLAVDRARYEAHNGRLGAAARAAGLTERFGSADLAVLSTTAPSHPAMFAFVPNLDGLRPGPWLLDLLGDDLAWSAGLEPPTVDAPRARVLHALWRRMWKGEIQPDDPAITALGPAAIRATEEMLGAYKKNRR